MCDRVVIINKGKLVANDTLNNLQTKNKNNHSIIVQFKEPVSKIIIEKISPAEKKEELSESHFRITTTEPELVRKQILEVALQNNLNIVSLQSQNQSLEEIFRSLTQQAETVTGN